MDSLSLAGKVAIVTGGSRGIGAETALLLARRGADVHVHYSSSPDAAEGIVKQIQALGRKADIIKCDLASKTCGAEIFEQVKKSEFGGGKIDICVWNAAVAKHMPLEGFNEENFDEQYEQQMNINVRSVVLCTMAALPSLNQGSRIILVSSVAARGRFPTTTVYGATKASLEHFAKVWSKELGAKYGATVNCVNPGPVATEMLLKAKEANKEFAGMLDAIVKTTPVEARMGTTDDIAQIIGFLASDSARWVSGSTVSANGGLHPN